MPPLLSGSICLLLLLLGSAALGRRILVLWRAGTGDMLERGVLALGLGLGALQAVPFALFALGLGSGTGFRIVASLLSVALLPDVVAVSRSALRSIRLLRPQTPTAWMLCLTYAGLLALLLPRAVCPITDHDGLSYHLAAVSRYLQAERFVFVPTLTYANWPLGVESLFALLRGIWPDAPVALAQLALGIVASAGGLLVARRCGGPAGVALAATLLLAYRVFWEQTTIANVDLGGACMATVAVLALVMSDRGGDRRLIRVSAVLAGLAATTKLLCAWVPVALAILLLGAQWRRGQRRALLHAAGYLAIAAIVVAPWLARTWRFTGNPVYPMLYSVFGGAEWTGEGWPRVQRYFLLLNQVPGIPSTTAALTAVRFALAGAVLGLFALVAWRTRASATALPARFACLVSALIFAGSGYNLRFLLAAFPCAVAATGPAIARRWPRFAAALCWLAPLLALRAGITDVPLPLGQAYAHALGRMPSEAVMASHVPDYAVTQYANRFLPPNARILVSTWEEDTALYGPIAYRANYWLQDSVHYDSRARLASDLRRLRVTHLVLAPLAPWFCARSAVCSGRAAHEETALAALARENGRPVYRAGDTTLYELRLPASQ